jgi:hypothetical protein
MSLDRRRPTGIWRSGVSRGPHARTAGARPSSRRAAGRARQIVDVLEMRQVRRSLDRAQLGRILPASARQGRASRAEGQQAPLIDRSLAERVRAPAAVAVERPVELRVASTLVDGRADVILDEPNDVIPDEPMRWPAASPYSAA